MKLDRMRWEVQLTETTAAAITIDPRTHDVVVAITGLTVKTQQACEFGLALLEASRYAGQARAAAGVRRVHLTRAGGYDPALGPEHPSNIDETLVDGPAAKAKAKAALERGIVEHQNLAKGDKIEALRDGRWVDCVVEFVKGGSVRYVAAKDVGEFMDFVSLSDEGKTWRRPEDGK